MTKRHRSAVTGEYVTAEQAKADPERTVAEAVRAVRVEVRNQTGLPLCIDQSDEGDVRVITLRLSDASQ